jgi:transposase-like protein
MNYVNHYSEEFKLKVVHEVLRGEISKEGCRKKYGIKGHSTVLKWIRKFGLSTEPKIMGQKKKKANTADLQAEIRLLKKELSYEKLKSEGLSEMIEIAEEELKISIRKKSGAKQSKR